MQTEGPTPTEIRTFLIADVRGYTLFTQERGDEAAAKLASRFAEIARAGVEARGGSVIELRGDEALAVFSSPRQALRAAVDLQTRFAQETVADPSLPLPVGIGLDAGEAVPLEGGYRGGALNLAARLCGQAGPGEVLASAEVVHLARKVEGLTYVDRGSVSLKGLAEQVKLIRVIPEDAQDPAAVFAGAPRVGPRHIPATPARIALAAGLVVAVVIGAILLLNWGGRGGAGGSPKASASGGATAALAGKDRVVRINPSTKQVVASIATGRGPSGVALGEGSVWVANSGDGTVSRIDPVANKVSGVIPVGKRPVAIAFGEGAIWVANYLGNSVSRIDTATNTVVATISLDAGPTGIAAGAGSVFVASASQTIATAQIPQVIAWVIDPDTNAVTATSHVVGNCNGLVAEGEGAAWVMTEQAVARVKPATGEILNNFTPGVAIFGITVGDGSVWVAGAGLPGRVLRLDAAGERVEAEIPVGNSRLIPRGPCPRIAMATGNGSLWVTNLDDGSISQIATVSNDVVDSFVVGKGLTGLALGQGGLWATVDAP